MPATDTDMQRRFAAEYATNGGNGTAAAKAAGYAERSAHELARRMLQNPTVLEHIRKHLLRLQARSGAVGLHALLEVCQDPKNPAAARVAAARALCEHAGILGAGKSPMPADDDAERPDGLMTAKDVLVEFRKIGQGAA